MSIKELVMNKARSAIDPSNYAFGCIEVVVEDKIIWRGRLILDLKVSDVQDKSEQEIIRLITTGNTPTSLPDRAKVYLYIDYKHYLLEDAYRPELYY